MRVLFTVSDLDLGGAQKQLVELARELVRRGHEVAIYTTNDVVPRAQRTSRARAWSSSSTRSAPSSTGR